ncbi:hypothetical protein LTS18_009827 [Coniosporium uncinatum]|uniref:Uncharacterized protein n=1 Tax=Coniosporium uncinatum TaxID=93489 RepID=A0ACC3DA76_9PEZI|nr:hypothetical protein LTS18_009827 [Coniosporium uncinatum]
MASLVHALRDLISSILETISAIFTAAYDLIAGTLHGIFSFCIGVVNLALETLQGTLNAMGGVGKFIISNFVVIAVVGLAAFVFLTYQRSQGRPVVVGNKKLN